MTSLRGLGVGESSQIPLRCTVPSRCAKIRSLTEKLLHPEQNISIRECSSMSRYAEYADCGVIALACSAVPFTGRPQGSPSNAAIAPCCAA